ERLQLLLEINNAMVSNLDLPNLMKTISSCLRKVSPYDSVGLVLYDEEANQLRGYANILYDDGPIVKEGQLIPLEGSMAERSFTTGEPVFLDRLDDERFQSDWSRRFRDAGFKSGGCVPLISHSCKLGVLGVATRRETHFSEDETELLWQVGNQVAIAVENALA